MAYTLKYYKTLSQPDGSNILLEIYEKDGTGASKEIGPVIQILRMDIQGSQNDIDTPIVKTSLTMTFVDAPDHEESSSKKCGNWEEFYTPDSTYWKVVLKSDSSSGSFRQIWGGYVTPDSFSEQLRYRGSVTIIARDNIGHLQDFPFDAEGNEDGMITVYDLVNTAWAKIGSPMSLDWRGEEDNALWLQCNGTDAPSAYMNVSAFEGKNWYEAVEDVLYSMGMVMRYVGNNTVQVSSLRYMQYQGKGDMSALPRIEPKFVAHAQRELAPAAKRIEESVKFELTDGKLAPLADGVLFTGLKGTSPFISENVFGEETIYDIPVWPIANIGDLGWSNVQSRTLFIDPSQYTLSGDMADDAKRMIFIAGNTGNSRAVSFGQRMACRDFRIELQFGRVAERMNNRLSYAWFVWPARFRGYLSVLQNGITQYYNGSGWQAAEYLIDEEIVEGMFAMDVPLSKFVGSAIVKLTIQEIVIGWKIGDVSDGQGLYVAISSLKSSPIKSSLLETNRVNTNYDETNNVIIKRDPSLAPAYNEVPFPQVIKNGIFLIQDGAYVPAKEWAWPGGTPHQMAVYNHLQLLCYYAKPNNVITGDIINADLGDIRALYVWEGKEHLLQGGSLNFLNGRIEGAILREFTRYESLWGAMTRSVAMPEVEESSTTNLESGSSPASDSYDINTEVYLGGGGGTIVIDKAMSDTSQNAVENRVIKAYIDAGDNLIKEEIEKLKQQSGADTPSSFYHDMAAIVSHAGMITRQAREQLYNIFSYTEGNDIASEPAWVIDSNGQHYIVRMLQTETGVGFFIIGYEGFTRIEGDNTKTNQLLRDKADKKYVDGTFFSQAQFDQIASNQYVVGNVAYQTDSDTGLRRLSLSLGLRIQNDIDAAVNDRPDDNGNYTNGLVTALGVKNWVESKGYLTSSAMNGYATKEDIKDFLSTSGGTITGALTVNGNLTAGLNILLSGALKMSNGRIEGVNQIIHYYPGAYNIDEYGNFYAPSDATDSSFWGFKRADKNNALTVYAESGKVEIRNDAHLARYGGVVSIGTQYSRGDAKVNGTLYICGDSTIFEDAAIEYKKTSDGLNKLVISRRVNMTGDVYVDGLLTMNSRNIEGVAAIIHKYPNAYNIDQYGNFYAPSTATDSSYWNFKRADGKDVFRVFAGTGTVETSYDTTLGRNGGATGCTINMGTAYNRANTNVYGDFKVIGYPAEFKNGITLGGVTINSWADAGAMPTKSQTTTSGTVSIAPNVLNKWSYALTGTLTITFVSGTSGVANYYMIEFTTGANIPTINLPSGITWQGGDNLLARLEPNKTYQISVLNNLAVGGAF